MYPLKYKNDNVKIAIYQVKINAFKTPSYRIEYSLNYKRRAITSGYSNCDNAIQLLYKLSDNLIQQPRVFDNPTIHNYIDKLAKAISK